MFERFIPKRLKANREVYTSTKMILQINSFIFPASLCLLPVFYSIGFQGGVAMALFALVCSFIFPFLIRASANVHVIGNYFAFCSVLTFGGLVVSSGGVGSPFLFWFFSVPPIGFLYLRKSHALTWSGFVGMTVFLVALAGWLNLLPISPLTPTTSSIIGFISFSLISILFVMVILNFRKTFMKMNRLMQKGN